MAVLVSMLRGVNVGSHNRLKMDDLRNLYESLGLRGVQTLVQSGNVVFKTQGRDLSKLATRIEAGIESGFGIHTNVLLRNAAELREAIAANPFATRKGIEPGKLLVTFLAREPGPEAREKLLAVKIEPEELRIQGREIYIYFPNGMAAAKLPSGFIDRAIKMPCTGRNWNTVTKLLEMAAALET